MKAETRRFRLTGIIRGGILFLCGLVLAACSLLPASLTGRIGGNVPNETPEILIPVTRGTITTSISFVGNVRYSQSSILTWKTSGVIDQVFVQPGDSVKRGDILAVLAADSLPYSVIIAERTMIEQQEKLEDVKNSASGQMQAFVTLNAKESALKQAKLSQEALYYPRATRQEMELAWDSLALANLNFNYAKQDYDHLVESNAPWEGFEEEVKITINGHTILVSGADSRSGRERKFEDYVSTYNTLVSAYEKYLWVTGEPSATDYAVAEGNVQVAQMEYDQALEEYLSYETLPREQDVHAAEVSLNNAETIYNQRFVTAPFDGMVTAVDAVAGYYVTRGASSVRIDDMRHIYVPISIPELDISITSVGMPVTITLDAVPVNTYSGHILSIDEASDSSGRTSVFSAVVEIDDPDQQILAGMTAEVTLAIREKTDALLIPNSAITYTEGIPTVTLADGEERQTLEITIGSVSDSVSEVTSGNLPEGAQLVLSSISAETLTQLGLDPSDYLQDQPAGRAEPRR